MSEKRMRLSEMLRAESHRDGVIIRSRSRITQNFGAEGSVLLDKDELEKLVEFSRELKEGEE